MHLCLERRNRISSRGTWHNALKRYVQPRGSQLRFFPCIFSCLLSVSSVVKALKRCIHSSTLLFSSLFSLRHILRSISFIVSERRKGLTLIKAARQQEKGVNVRQIRTRDWDSLSLAQDKGKDATIKASLHHSAHPGPQLVFAIACDCYTRLFACALCLSLASHHSQVYIKRYIEHWTVIQWKIHLLVV